MTTEIRTFTASDYKSVDDLPWTLALNRNAEPLGWLTYDEVATQYCKGNILWSMGTFATELRGGTNAVTGQRSKLVYDSIIGIDNSVSPFSRSENQTAPTLSNTQLFKRDCHLCAYCGYVFRDKELSRDHVHPESRGGPDVWENVVTSCKPCNHRKGNRTLGEAKMELLYIPYSPNYFEALILRNRKILADQQEFLMRGVHKHSRLHMKMQ